MRSQFRDDAGPNRFFLNSAPDPAVLRREIFYLSYHLHWSWSEAMGLETRERGEFVRLLSETIEQENDRVVFDMPGGRIDLESVMIR